MAVTLRRVESRRDLKAFIRFPVDLYRGNPNYVPSFMFDELNTLDRTKNPAFEFSEAEYFLAEREGRIVGRIAAIVNRRYAEKWGRKYARFGWMDFIDDFEAASALVGAAEDWARERGMEGIHGPLGFTDLDREGLLVEGFDEPATLATNYNHPYYGEFLERLGYAKDIDWFEYRINVPSEIPAKIARVTELLMKRTGVRLFPWKRRSDIVSRFGKEFFALIDEAYSGLYGTTPLSERQVSVYIDQYLGFIDPRFTKLLVDAEGKLVGFGLAMPSLSRALTASHGRLLPFGWIRILMALRRPAILDLYLVAVRKEYKSRGVVAILMAAFNQSAIAAGVKVAESNLELENNVEVQQMWKEMDRRRHKRVRAYLKKL
jgi:GNAT superfamily N-acetyltransferase